MSLGSLMDFFLHMDKYLSVLINQHTTVAYVFLFVVIFIETGLVICPFLPGDSLIFVTAALAAAGAPIFSPFVLLLLYAAAISGDTLNYHIGHLLREKIKRRTHLVFVRMEYLDRTQRFFEKHGGKTITIARFVPIIRTFAPFVAGASEMPYRWFLGYNVLGGISWVSVMFAIGYFFGNIPYVKNHFSLVVVAIIVISVLPAILAFLKSKMETRKHRKENV
ncbi:SNARE associated Golgi protein-related protein [Ethanoligenens harbinense YUAN-3]|uniref:SNARE associated Golgi protein-related protein n=2 Tax=Ethanoligenens harbinense TaxID=253239 RepID=E6U4C2_ETHHY|nr:SNARE associated Golgi protein-related protein [Ethanoligenens harbinense YUAN-3]